MKGLIFLVLVVGMSGCGDGEQEVRGARELARLRGCVKASAEDAGKLLGQAQRGEISLTSQARERLEMVRARGGAAGE